MQSFITQNIIKHWNLFTAPHTHTFLFIRYQSTLTSLSRVHFDFSRVIVWFAKGGTPSTAPPRRAKCKPEADRGFPLPRRPVTRLLMQLIFSATHELRDIDGWTTHGQQTGWPWIPPKAEADRVLRHSIWEMEESWRIHVNLWQKYTDTMFKHKFTSGWINLKVDHLKSLDNTHNTVHEMVQYEFAIVVFIYCILIIDLS